MQKQKQQDALEENSGDCINISSHSHVCTNTNNNTKHRPNTYFSINRGTDKGIRIACRVEKDTKDTISISNQCGYSEPDCIESYYVSSRGSWLPQWILLHHILTLHVLRNPIENGNHISVQTSHG
jgi:hypothetical protein